MLQAIPHRDRHPLHGDINVEAIDRMVETFYGRIQTHPRLGPIFNSRLDGRWPVHLAKMKDFWASVLLRAGVYKGQPVPTHRALSEVVPEDYRLWLGLFRQVAGEIYTPAAAQVVIGAAERIAESLWLATFGTAMAQPPAWMHERS